MNIFHIELEKKFKKLYKRDLFNSCIDIKFSYLKELEKRNIDNVLIGVLYDNSIKKIIGYNIIEYTDILNLDDIINSYFIICYDKEYKKEPEIRILDKKQIIYLSVKKYIRILKIKTLL